jgi:hypothetical protein
MRHNTPLLAASLLLGLTTLDAQASLTTGTSDGKSVVYSSNTNISWIEDADLLGTLISSQSYKHRC